RATAAAGWKLDAAGASSLDLDLTLKGLDDIYDRSELKGPGGSLALRLRGGQLSLDSPGQSARVAASGLPVRKNTSASLAESARGGFASRCSWMSAANP
ncbi:hypothetical protein ACV34Z_35275, partial [Pseudomonas aeruginosa]